MKKREERREERKGGERRRKGWKGGREGGRVPVSKTTLNVCGGVPIETGP